MNKAVQYFSDEALERGRAMSVVEIIAFVEGFRQLHGQVAEPAKSKLISLKVPEPLLAAFKTHARLNGVKYQTRIKQLMLADLENNQAVERF